MSIKPRLYGPDKETEEEWFEGRSPEILANRRKERARLKPLLAELGVDDDPALGLDSDLMTSREHNDLVLRIIQLERETRNK